MNGIEYDVVVIGLTCILYSGGRGTSPTVILELSLYAIPAFPQDGDAIKLRTSKSNVSKWGLAELKS